MKKYTQAEIDALIIVEDNRRIIRNIDLSRCDLSGLNLSNIKFEHANLEDAILVNANLYGAILRGANLISANLMNATGNMREIKSLQLDTWRIVYTADNLWIGCKHYSIEEWRNFTDEQIDNMGLQALAWWKKWKKILFDIIDIDKIEQTMNAEGDKILPECMIEKEV